MKKNLTAGVTCVLIALSAAADAQDTAAPIESQPVLIFTLAVGSETVDTWNASLATALVTGIVGEARRSAHAKFLSTLESVSVNDGQALEFMRPLVCLDSMCRQPVRLAAPLAARVYYRTPLRLRLLTVLLAAGDPIRKCRCLARDITDSFAHCAAQSGFCRGGAPVTEAWLEPGQRNRSVEP